MMEAPVIADEVVKRIEDVITKELSKVAQSVTEHASKLTRPTAASSTLPKNSANETVIGSLFDFNAVLADIYCCLVECSGNWRRNRPSIAVYLSDLTEVLRCRTISYHLYFLIQSETIVAHFSLEIVRSPRQLPA